MRMGFWAKNSKGRRSWESDLISILELEEVTAVRMLVKRSVVATRGRSLVDGILQISWKSSGKAGISKGDAIKLMLTLRRFGRPLNASVRSGT